MTMFRSVLVILCSASLLVACGVQSAAPPPAASAADSVVPAATDGSLRWIGGPTALIERGGLRVITDPMLGPRAEQAFTLPRHPSSGVVDAPVARYLSPAPLSLAGLDAILISHTHNDHVDAVAKQQLPKDLPLVVSAAGAEAMRAAGFRDVRPLDWGESVTLNARGCEPPRSAGERCATTLRVLAVPAHHAHEAELDQQLGRGNGYVLEWRDARGSYRIYWTGDAVLSDESQGFASQYGPIDLLLPHMGGVGGDGGHGLRTMNAAEAVQLMRRVDPRLVIPIHHTTFAHYREPIDALAEQAREAGLGDRLHFVALGESFALPVH